MTLLQAQRTSHQIGPSSKREFIDLKSRHKELTSWDRALYSLLFGDNISYQSTDDPSLSLEKAGLKFPEKVKLLSVFQNSPMDASVSLHGYNLQKKDGSIYVSLKTGPNTSL